MIKEKFLKFLLWFKDHFSILLEVVFRLAVGKSKETNEITNNSGSSPAPDVSEKERGVDQ